MNINFQSQTKFSSSCFQETKKNPNVFCQQTQKMCMESWQEGRTQRKPAPTLTQLPWRNALWLCSTTHIEKEKKRSHICRTARTHTYYIDMYTEPQVVLPILWRWHYTFRKRPPPKIIIYPDLGTIGFHHRTISEWEITDNLNTQCKLTSASSSW